MWVAALTGSAAEPGRWTALPALPDKEGFASMFAGVSGGALLAAGGANFPDKRPWEGGKKVWYDTVFVLAKPDGQWQFAGKLPRPLGYGVSVTHGGQWMHAGSVLHVQSDQGGNCVGSVLAQSKPIR